MNKIKYIFKVSFVMLFFLVFQAQSVFGADDFFASEEASSILSERLDRLDGAFDYTLTPEVQRLIKLYLGKHKSGSQSILGKSMIYFPLIEDYIEKKRLPEELKYIPIIESSLRPYAKSRVGAAGLWQFMRKTGRMMGLKINSTIDERNDPIKSTEAALEYLTMLYHQLDDWTLALAAYNCGAGNVRKAIRKAGSRNFWDIEPYLPRETRKYIPKFMATSYVINYYIEHGLTPLFDEVVENPITAKVHEELNFKKIARKLNMDVKTIKQLNPTFLKGYIPRSQDGHYFTLPEEKFIALSAELKNFYAIVYQPMKTEETFYYEDLEAMAKEESIPYTRHYLDIALLPSIDHSTGKQNVNKSEVNHVFKKLAAEEKVIYSQLQDNDKNRSYHHIEEYHWQYIKSRISFLAKKSSHRSKYRN